jgi:integrase
MYQHMTERGLSARTIRYAHVLIKSAMQQAVRWRLLLENPADGLKVPQQVRNEMRSLTVEQARALLKAAEGTKYGPVLAVALTTGMRPSEYLGLKWQDIDWARQTASVVRSIRRLNGKMVLLRYQTFEKPSSNQGLLERKELDRRSNELALSILEALSARQRDRLMTAMGEVERLLQASMVCFAIEDPTSADARWCFNQYLFR